jgi:Flp pilus assembly protein TadD
LPEALKVFEFIVSENPGHTSANTNLGYLYMQQGNNAMAYEYMMHANYLDPDYEQNLMNLAVWHYQNKQLDKAKTYLEHLLKKHPGNQQARERLMDLMK